MILFEYISQNIERIKKEVQYGVISQYIFKYFEIYCRYDYYKKAGYNKMDSCLYTGEDYDLSDEWIYKIIKRMEAEI